MTEEQIKHMVDRFLGWKLPEKFKPDAGISYTPLPYGKSAGIPTGTNLFDAEQAAAMVRYLVDGLPAAVSDETLTLKRRVTVLERVIAEDLNPNDCVDDANAMIVEEIHKRSDGLPRQA